MLACSFGKAKIGGNLLADTKLYTYALNICVLHDNHCQDRKEFSFEPCHTYDNSKSKSARPHGCLWPATPVQIFGD